MICIFSSIFLLSYISSFFNPFLSDRLTLHWIFLCDLWVWIQARGSRTLFPFRSDAPFFPSVLFTIFCSAFSLLPTPLLLPVTFSVLLPATLCSAISLLPTSLLYFRSASHIFCSTSGLLSYPLSPFFFHKWSLLPTIIFYFLLLPRTLQF